MSAGDQTFAGWLLAAEIHSSPNARVFRVSRGDETAIIKICATWNASKPTYRRFCREISTLRELNDDPGVMSVLDAAIPDPPRKGHFPWYVMPEGMPFAEALKDADLIRVVEAVASVAATLSRLHQRDLHHRDVKPANLFELEGGTFVVGDLGLVGRPPASEDPAITQSGEKLGPANFLAPEMLQVDPEQVDARFADVYSLSKVLWSLASGHDYPLPGPQRASDATSLAAGTEEGRAAELDDLIERATANEPERRPSMNQMASELLAWLEQHAAPPVDKATGLDQVVANARARLASQHDQQQSIEREMEAAEDAFDSLVEALEPIHDALVEIGTISNLNDFEPLIGSALQWASGETMGGPSIREQWEHLAFAQAGTEPNAVRLHLAVRLILYEGGEFSVGVGIDVTHWPMASGSSAFHWREIFEDVPVESIRAKREIERLARLAIQASPEAINTFSIVGQQLS